MQQKLIPILTITVFLMIGGSTSVFAVGTPAGTLISNFATLEYTVGGSPTLSIDSVVGDADVTVAELIELQIDLVSSTLLPVEPGASNQARTFRLSNIGNGTEDFILTHSALAGGAGEFTPATVNIYIDSDGDDVFNILNDTQYLGGTGLTINSNLLTPNTDGDPLVNDTNNDGIPDAVIHVLGDIPNTGVADGEFGNVRLTAQSDTVIQFPGVLPGTVAPGHIMGSVGDTGLIDAIVGNSQGQAVEDTIGSGTAALPDAAYVIQTLVLEIDKAVVSTTDPFGNTTPGFGSAVVPGTEIQYGITVSITGGTGTANNVFVTDTMPPNTTYKANSIEYDNGVAGFVAQVDTGGGDEGEFDTVNNDVEVTIGTISAGDPSHNIRFIVTVD